MVRQDRGFDPYLVDLQSVADSSEMIKMSSRNHFNKRALLSNYKPMVRIENPAIQLAPWF